MMGACPKVQPGGPGARERSGGAPIEHETSRLGNHHAPLPSPSIHFPIASTGTIDVTCRFPFMGSSPYNSYDEPSLKIR